MSLFPSTVRSRLYMEQQERQAEERPETTKTRLKNFLNQGDEAHRMEIAELGEQFRGSGSRPIADLFPATTVLFADIATFTAWSSIRDPIQVFTFLETIYSAFDEIATKRGVFKVETIGDSYVAVAGLPEPRDDHAEVMVKFAADCREKFSVISRELEVCLGPDTGEV
jgi:class 3 adenylate cyclase